MPCLATDVNGAFNLPQYCFTHMAWAFVAGVDSVDGRFRQLAVHGAHGDSGILGVACRCPRYFAVDKPAREGRRTAMCGLRRTGRSEVGWCPYRQCPWGSEGPGRDFRPAVRLRCWLRHGRGKAC